MVPSKSIEEGKIGDGHETVIVRLDYDGVDLSFCAGIIKASVDRARLLLIFHDGEKCIGDLASEGGPIDIGQNEAQCVIRFDDEVIDDWDQNGLISFSIRKYQRPGYRHIINSSDSGP